MLTGSTISLHGRSGIEISKPRKGRVPHVEPEAGALFTKQKMIQNSVTTCTNLETNLKGFNFVESLLRKIPRGPA